MNIPDLIPGGGNEFRCNIHNNGVKELEVVLKEYSGDMQSSCEERKTLPLVMGLDFQATMYHVERLKELKDSGIECNISLIEGNMDPEGIGVEAYALLPWKGVTLKKGTKKEISNKFDFLYETFSKEVHERGNIVVGLLIDDVNTTTVYKKFHRNFEQAYLARGVFCRMRDSSIVASLQDSLLTYVKRKLDTFKKQFGIEYN